MASLVDKNRRKNRIFNRCCHASNGHTNVPFNPSNCPSKKKIQTLKRFKIMTVKYDSEI